MTIAPSFIIFGSPLIGEDEIAEVLKTIKSSWLGTGPKVKEFEQKFAAYKGAKYTAAVSSCTAALHLSMLGAGIGPGDEVITTPLTFAATVNAIIHAGATPVLADIDPQTFNIDPSQILQKITAKTKAILPVHFAGRPCEMDKIMSLAQKHNLKVIEDCAHAIETEYHQKPAGTFGDFGCCSFYVTKNITTVEGGMVIAKREEDISRIKVMALHGMSKDAWHRFGDQGYRHYYVIDSGFKYNMTDLQASFGIHQIDKIDQWWQRRKEIWDHYNNAFSNLPLSVPAANALETKHSYHLYTILVDEARCGITRDAFLEQMTVHKIGVGVHYLSIPEHPYYRERFSWKPEDYPHAMKIGRQTVSLPLSPKLTADDISRIVSAVKEILS